jgi:YidC/Oxa1 family membrane protein insertase
MEMDKRTVIALVLAGLVLIVFMMMSEHQKPQPAAQKKTTAQTAGAPATPGTAPHIAKPAVAVPDLFWTVVWAGPTAEEKTVTVIHPLYTARFTASGARLLSLVLQGTAAKNDRHKAYYETVQRKIPIQMVSVGLNTRVPDDRQLAQAVAKDPALTSALLWRLIDVMFESHLPLTIGLDYLPGGVDLSRAKFEVNTDRVDAVRDVKTLVFTYTVPGQYRVLRTYTFHPKTYAIGCQVRVENLSRKDALRFQPRLHLYNRPDLDHSGNFRGIQYLVEGKSVDEMALDRIKPGVVKYDLKAKVVRWVAYSDPYFLTALVAPKPVPTNVKFTRLGLDLVSVLYQGANQVVDPVGGPHHVRTQDYMFYLGPKSTEALTAAGSQYQLPEAIDFGFFDIIAKPLLWLMKIFYSVIPNYGVAIILLTILLKIMFWPLTHKSYASMKRMGELQPKIKELRAQYGDDKQKMNQEMMALWKAHKVNPMGGCWPMLLQIPVFFALFQFLRSAIELRHAPFILWINDLSVPDRLPLGFNIPYVDKGLPVLTILMAVSMWLQMKITPSAGDPKQQKMMAMIMPAVFLFIFLGMPSGLVLYWLVYNILSIGQQWRIHNPKTKKKAA